jgi:aspartate aminotransferase
MLYEISEKVHKLESEGKRIIKFNVGDPDQQTDKRIVDAAMSSMAKGMSKYGSAFGLASLRKKLAEEYGTETENVMITPGSKWAIFAAMRGLLSRGSNVIIISPHWTSYGLAAVELGAQVKILKTSLEENWSVDADALKELIDDKTRLIIVNSPNNPTGKIISAKTLKEIASIAEEKGVRILSDETYSDISFKKHTSMMDIDRNQILVHSLSKTFAMTGWRIGYAIADRSLIESMAKLNQMTITCVPSFVQEAAVKALELRKEIADRMRSVYEKRTRLAMDMLSKTSLKFSEPDAPFYLFPRCDTDSEKLAFRLLDKGVAITPGTAFGDYREFFRIALTLPDEEIKIGLEKIASEF